MSAMFLYFDRKYSLINQNVHSMLKILMPAIIHESTLYKGNFWSMTLCPFACIIFRMYYYTFIITDLHQNQRFAVSALYQLMQRAKLYKSSLQNFAHYICQYNAEKI